MPVPLPQPGPSTQVVQPQQVWMPGQQDWAIQQEQVRHAQALYSLGEMAMFILLWTLMDYEAGLVDRCSTCYTSYGKIADVYKEPMVPNCPDCLGTTFEGGYRAKIVRPTLWTDTSTTYNPQGRRGVTETDDVTVETIAGFTLHATDYIVRQDDRRYQSDSPSNSTLRTGFGYPDDPRTTLGWVNARVTLEDRSSIAYTIPPTGVDLAMALAASGDRFPPDFTALEDVRGPLEVA